MLPRNVWLVTPFIVLAIVVASFTVTPLWVQHRAARVREPASTALASSVQAIGALIDMRDQLHRAIVLGDPAGDAEGAHAGRLSRLLTDELAAEQRRAIAASLRLEEIRARSTRLANDLNILVPCV